MATLVNQPVHCANCNRYLNTVRYFTNEGDEHRSYDDVYCRRPACREAEMADAGTGESTAAPTPASLEDMTRAELYELAQEHEVPQRSKMNVDELRAAVAEAIA
jgi:hypothetical protein